MVKLNKEQLEMLSMSEDDIAHGRIISEEELYSIDSDDLLK